MDLVARMAAPESGKWTGNDQGAPSSPRSDVQLRPIRVLIVDDDRETARALERCLLQMNSQVSVACSGETALSAVRATQFDVVLSDIGMPGMDGFALLHAVRQLDVRLPVVLLTGEPSAHSAVRATQGGAFRFITKAIQPLELREVIEKAAHLHREARAQSEAEQRLQLDPLSDPHFSALGASLDRCLGSLRMAYQPIIDPHRKRIFGYEGLLRSSEADYPSPVTVLEAAEHLSRLADLGQRVRGLTAHALVQAPPKTLFFVNLHTQDLLDPDLYRADAPLSLCAPQVVLELTERGRVDAVPELPRRLAALRQLGFRLAIDDLGAGYSDLNTLTELEPEFVKLDMKLVRGIETHANKRKVVRALIHLAQDMGMLVVGEGVETHAERDVLIELGCDFLQGYLYARPASDLPDPIF